MKFLSFIIIIVVFSSCSLKEALDKGVGQAETNIKPIAQAKGLTEDVIKGSTFTVKFPLSESSIDPIELDRVLEGDDSVLEGGLSRVGTLIKANSKTKKFLKKIMRNLKLSVYNLALGFGYKNKVQFPMSLDLFEIDSKFIESAMIKRMFLTTDDCRDSEENCKGQKGLSSNFSLIDKVKINVDKFDHVRDRHLEDKDEENDVIFLGRKNSDEVDSLKEEDVFNRFHIEDIDSPAGERRKKLRGVNVLSFNNNIPYLNFEKSRGKYSIKINDTKEMAKVRNYLNSSKLSTVIKRTFLNRKFRKRNSGGIGKDSELIIVLQDNKTIGDLHYAINEDLAPELNNTVVFRLNSVKHASNFLKRARYKDLIKDITFINRSLFVEVTDREKFIKRVKSDDKKINDYMDIYKVQNCNVSTCLNLKSRKHNLVPMLTKASKLRLDLYAAIRSLGYIDFKINGFIEIEIKLKTSGSKLL